MISKTKIVVLVIIFTQYAFCQNEDINVNFNPYSSSLFDSHQNSLFVVSKMKTETLQDSDQNNVILKQIGDYNVINANVNASNSNLIISQNGTNNTIELNKNTLELTQQMSQIGNNNSITDLTYFTNYKVNMELNQNGDYQSIQNIGTNSLSKDMKISQTGIGASIIIINH